MKILKEKKYRILSIVSRYLFVFIIALSMLFPTIVVKAKTVNGVTSPQSDGTTVGAQSDGITNGVQIKTGINNPIKGINDIPTLIKAILNFVLFIGVPIVALAIIYSGFLFVTASGNSEKLKKAKSALLYTLIGAALLLGSLVIANSIKGTVDQINSSQ